MPAGLPNHLPLWRLVLALAIWPFLEQLMGALVFLVDSVLAGHLNEAIVKQASEAIGGAAYIMWLMAILQGSVGVAATALISRSVGGGDFEEADEALAQTIFISLIWGVFNGVLFYALAPYVGGWLNLSPLGAQMASDYVRILAVVAPIRAVLFIGGACLRGAGDTKSPFFIMLLVNVVNLIVSIALVSESSPVGGMAVRGIAIGTTVAWIVGGLVMAALLLKGRSGIRLRLAKLKPAPRMIGRLLRVGVPALFENGGHWAGNFFIILIVGELARSGVESYPMAPHNFAIRIESFSFLPGFAFSIAAATLVGQYLGAGDPRTARKSLMWSWLYAGVLMTIMGVVFITIPDLLVNMVTNDPAFRETTPKLLAIAGWGQLGFATALVLSGGIRGAGDTRTSMFITFGSTFLIRLPAAYIIAIPMGYGLVGLWIGLVGELVIRGLFYLARFLHGGWVRVKV